MRQRRQRSVFVRPMLATLIDKPFDDSAWVFETKWDGFRIVARIDRGKVTLYSRNGKKVSERYPSIVQALSKINHDAVIDGELVALDRRGRSRFQLLQNALRTSARLRYCAFDLMFLDGRDMRKLPLLNRKAALKRILPAGNIVRFSRHRVENGTRFFKQARKAGEEGIMGKRSASIYRSGVRSRDWLKIKTGWEQEAVIVGFTRPQRSRKYFGSLALAVRDGKRWRYIGHVGTGFDATSLRAIHAKLAPLKTAAKPFDQKVKYEAQTTWVRPKLVGEVKFTEWTARGEMRHPAFLGLRDDKRAADVIMERSGRV